MMTKSGLGRLHARGRTMIPIIIVLAALTVTIIDDTPEPF